LQAFRVLVTDFEGQFLKIQPAIVGEANVLFYRMKVVNSNYKPGFLNWIVDSSGFKRPLIAGSLHPILLLGYRISPSGEPLRR
jgi:hypothetical protein